MLTLSEVDEERPAKGGVALSTQAVSYIIIAWHQQHCVCTLDHTPVTEVVPSVKYQLATITYQLSAQAFNSEFYEKLQTRLQS